MSNDIIFVCNGELAFVLSSLELLKRHIRETNEPSAVKFYRSVEPLLYSKERYQIFRQEYRDRLAEATKRCTPNESGYLVNEYDCLPETEAVESIADHIWGIDYAYGQYADMYNDILKALFEDLTLRDDMENILSR